MPVEVRIDPPSAARDVAELARRFKELGDSGRTKKEFVKALRTGTTPGVRRAKAAARALPSRSRGRSKGFRRATARAVAAQVKTAGDARVTVRISRRGEMAKYQDLPRLLNRYGEFKHPVFGKGEVTQQGAPGWFDDVMKDASTEVRDKLFQVMDTFEKKLMRNV